MARSGRSVHGDIKRKIREVQSEFEGLSTRYDETERTMSQMIDERESHYMTIASHCLPELERDAVNNTIRGMKTKIRDIFDEKQERREQLQQLMLKNRESNTEVEGEIDTLTQKIEHLAEQRDETMSVILYDLKKHDLYTGLKEDAGEAQTKLTSFEERVQDVTERIQEYLPSFEEHFVFNYLHSRGFGTNEYTKSGLIKKFDTFAARATHFLENKKRYDFLMSVPELMNHEVIRRQETLDDIAKQMGVIEREIEEKHGLPHIVKEAESLVTKRKALIEKDVSQDNEYDSFVQEREELDGTNGRFYTHALNEMDTYLKGKDIDQLRQIAQKTPGSEDDRAVQRIYDIGDELEILQERASELRSDRRALSEKLKGLRKIESRFRNRDYEGGYSEFPDGFEIDSLLAGYMLGTISSTRVNSRIDSAQTTNEPITYSSPSSSDNSFFGSGIGFGGGGFSTGDSF